MHKPHNNGSTPPKYYHISFLRYNEKASVRSILDLKLPNFETKEFSLSTLCDTTESANKLNLTNYCNTAKKMPELETMMELLKLAKYPLNFDSTTIVPLLRLRKWNSKHLVHSWKVHKGGLLNYWNNFYWFYNDKFQPS